MVLARLLALANDDRRAQAFDQPLFVANPYTKPDAEKTVHGAKQVCVRYYFSQLLGICRGWYCLNEIEISFCNA
jgi:hypothetical protein